MSASLAVIGSFVQDLAFKVGEFPAPGQTIIGNFFTGPGGKGSNQAVAAHRQGVPTVFIACVGNDPFATGYKEWTTREKLRTNLLISQDSPTGAASIVINQRAENAIVVALGANDALTPGHVTNALSNEPELKVILLQAESNLTAAEAALHYARSKGIFSLFNPAPINHDVSTRLLSLAECITPNETECAFLLERLYDTPCKEDLASFDDESLRSLCSRIDSPSILITLGSKGTVLYQKGTPHASIRGIAKGEILRTPAMKVTPIDTTGAGDAFNGGLAAGLVLFEGDLPRAIRYATVVAGLSVERLGTAPAMPTASEVQQFASFYN